MTLDPLFCAEMLDLLGAWTTDKAPSEPHFKFTFKGNPPKYIKEMFPSPWLPAQGWGTHEKPLHL